jgi:tRNA G46 methylase TrmB
MAAPAVRGARRRRSECGRLGRHLRKGCDENLPIGSVYRRPDRDHSRLVPAIRQSAADGLANIRLPDAALERVYLLHPDPWAKARHAKRRMINHGPLDLIAAKLKPGGEFRLGTDDPTYCRWAMMIMNQRRDFEWLA